MELPDFSIERRLWKKGYQYIVGVDEVGRGCLAGPVAAAAVVFDKEQLVFNGVNDSKKMTPRKRVEMFELITDRCVGWSVGFSSAAEVDDMGIVSAVDKSMYTAIRGVMKVDYVLIDGNRNLPELNVPSETIVRGDQKSFSVACASIVAKIIRDELMSIIHILLPEYGFERNKGYGTRRHREAIMRYGLSNWHRKTFRVK